MLIKLLGQTSEVVNMYNMCQDEVFIMDNFKQFSGIYKKSNFFAFSATYLCFSLSSLNKVLIQTHFFFMPLPH